MIRWPRRFKGVANNAWLTIDVLKSSFSMKTPALANRDQRKFQRMIRMRFRRTQRNMQLG